MIQVFRTRNRQAFTLVELLVVIAIIAVLASLSAWGVFAMIGSQQRRNTESSMRVINKLLQDRWAAVIADAKKETPSPQVFALAGGNKERAQVIWIKVRLVEAFPVAYSDVIQTMPVPPNSLHVVNTYIPAGQRKPHFTKYEALLAGKTGGGAGESSACLLMALKTLASDGVSVEDQLKPFVKDTDGDGMPELVDGWGKPLAFFRFPTGANIQAANPAAGTNSRGAKNADPIDAEGTLINGPWYNAPPFPPALNGRRIFESQFHLVGPAPSVPNAPPANAYYVIPVIASAGKDNNMALAADASPSGSGAADNIFNFQLRGD